MHELIGKTVLHKQTKEQGTIVSIHDGIVSINFYSRICSFKYPDAFSSVLLLKDGLLQKQYESAGSHDAFLKFKEKYSNALIGEIQYLKSNGGTRYRLFDGQRIVAQNNAGFLYAFDSDTELHFPDRTPVKLWLSSRIISAYVLYCDGFTITIQTPENLGDKISFLELSAEPWQLMESLVDRINEIDEMHASIAKELACTKQSQSNYQNSIHCGQDKALQKALTQPITIIWGPPGTGKTRTLASIALECIQKKMRVLMVSYSNVSVDGALLRVAERSDVPPGRILRYGYPRMKELVNSKTLTSYAFVLQQNPSLEKEYEELLKRQKKLKNVDSEKVVIRKRIAEIKRSLSEKEKRIIQDAAFLATTVSKAVVDASIYNQRFDVVIFDEASMAYVPQVIFAASLAKKHFCCLGDFCQLPAIVQNNHSHILSRDIFDYTGIKDAVNNRCGHEWLVMLNCQYRMHPGIAEFASKSMYGNMLMSSPGFLEDRQLIADLPPVESEPMCFVDLSHMYSVCVRTNDGSRINLLSAMMCIRIAEKYAGKYEVGIITPYSAQSKLIMSLLRDIQARNHNFGMVNCATVHQYQGSERAIIIYDAVDCFRMPYPGHLLTSKKEDIADRLFNVALTRTQGKFILVANRDYFVRKKLSKELMLAKALSTMMLKDAFIANTQILEKFGSAENECSEMFFGERDEVDSWERYLKDVNNAKKEVIIFVPCPMDDDANAILDLSESLDVVNKRGVRVSVLCDTEVKLYKTFDKFTQKHPYITMPVTLIDNQIIWYGEPISAGAFITEGETVPTKLFSCLRFCGEHACRMIKGMLMV